MLEKVRAEYRPTVVRQVQREVAAHQAEFEVAGDWKFATLKESGGASRRLLRALSRTGRNTTYSVES